MDGVESELEDIFTMLNDARYTHKDLENGIKENFDKLYSLLHAQGEAQKDILNRLQDIDYHINEVRMDVIKEVKTNKDIIHNMSVRLDRANEALNGIFLWSCLIFGLVIYIVYLLKNVFM